MKAIYTLVGMSHRSAEHYVRSLASGAELALIREPNNAFDPRAVQVWSDGRHVGYIAAAENRAVAARMDAMIGAGRASDAILKAKLVPGRPPHIEVEE